MADNVPITAGSGTTIATDEVNTGGGAAHVQLMKLLGGADGSTERIEGTAANGLEVDVTRLPALAAGTNNIGDVDVLTLPSLPAGTNNIGDVDVLSVVPGTSATSLGKAEDAAHTTGDVGVMALTVRQDTAAALGGTDGDYQPAITDASGRLHVNVGNTVTVNVRDDAGDSCMDGANNALRVNIVAGAAAGGTSATDEAAYTPTASAGTPIMGAADETAPDAAAEGTLAIIRSTLNRALHVNLRDSAGAELSVGGGTQYTEDAAAAANPVGNALNLVRDDARGGALTSTDGDNVAARGTNAGELYVKHVDSIPVTDNGGSLTVDGTVAVSGSVAVTNAGTFAVQESGAALTALQLIDNLVLAEDAAHQTGDPGVQVLAVRDDTLDVRSGAENDYEPLHTNANGALWTVDVNSAAQAASLSVLDDWDETDRAKVNIIVGQAGVTAGAGAVAANTPRVTMASDSPDVAALQIMDDWDNGASDGASVSGDVAHDAADAGEPVKLGHKAIDLGANPTDVAANDRTNWYAMRNGVPFVIGGAPFVRSQNLQVTDADGAQTDAAILTAAANVAIMVTAIEVTADNANTGDVSVRIGFGTVNTPAADADKVIMFHPGIAPGSGVVKGSGAGIIGAGLSGEDLRVTCEDPVGGSVSITITYFTLAIG